MVMVVMPSLTRLGPDPRGSSGILGIVLGATSRPSRRIEITVIPTRNPFIDDLTKMANGAMGALTGVKDEVEARVRDQIAKILDGMDIPRRDEFEAVKAMAAKAREENEELKKQMAELKAKLTGSQS